MFQGQVLGITTYDRCLSANEVANQYQIGLVVYDPRVPSEIVAEGKKQFAETHNAELWFDGVVQRLQELEASEERLAWHREYLSGRCSELLELLRR